MPRISVIYDSKTGFTELMAKAVVEGVESIEGVDVELLKVGTPFSISKLRDSDALIIGSPTIYGSVTSEMRSLLNSLKEQAKSNRITLTGKLGGVFGSYEWDGGWVVDKISADFVNLGIDVVASVSLVDGLGKRRTSLDENSLRKCRELGKVLAEKVQS